VSVFDRQRMAESLAAMVRDDFTFITLFTSMFVLAALYLAYGRAELMLITFIPMAVSWIWILGLMNIFGITFNFINIILSTLIFALGDDYCIFTMDGLQQEYARGVKQLRSVSASVLLSVITTVVGLGVLAFAGHPSLRSVGLVAVIGILSVWVSSQLIQPLLFRWFISGRASRGLQPLTLARVLRSVFAFLYFFAGSLLLSFTGFFLTFPNREKAVRGRRILTWLISLHTGSLVRIMFNIRKHRPPHSINLEKPAIIIANHQSFIDSLILLSMHPRLIMLPGPKMWNSILFGMVGRIAGYVRADRIQADLGKIRSRIDEGYSLVVFPEGTRSLSGKIGRFHKGAFWLAEQLDLDIIPVVINGSGASLPKNDFVVKSVDMGWRILPRIRNSDLNFGTGYSARAKNIAQYVRQQHRDLVEEMRTPKSLRNHLISNYLYKGPMLEWYMRVKVRLEGYYAGMHALVPQQGNVLDIGCGYGFLSYMLAWLSPGRSVTGIDFDEEKIAVAQHGYLRPANLEFHQQDASVTRPAEQDAIILCDVLHYLPPAVQDDLLERCVQGLAPRGVLIVREGLSDAGNRHRGTLVSEWLSIRVMGFNRTGGKKLNYVSSAKFSDLARAHGLQLSVIDNAKFTSNIIFVMRKAASL
jgi:1-acyl-sn-glycerol-3-phosphate acyltransferase